MSFKYKIRANDKVIEGESPEWLNRLCCVALLAGAITVIAAGVVLLTKPSTQSHAPFPNVHTEQP